MDQVRRAYRPAFEDPVEETRERLEGSRREGLAREVATVQAWLLSQEPCDKGLALVEEHERYVVALVDEEKARLFTVFLGEERAADAHVAVRSVAA